MKYVILHDIRSAYNVGAIFRTADGAGVSKIFLSGYTPAPLDRFGRVNHEIKKTSLGASESVPWQAVASLPELINTLRTSGVTVVAVEQTPESVTLSAYHEPAQVAYLFGNEIDGVPESLCLLADTIVDIPMHGQKESLNVSVAAGIVLYHGITQAP